jgi:acetyl/propionyl-CoA carboxylase alpha subunit
MALSDDDVREILRIIDESELDELRIETDGLSLHVLRGGAVHAIDSEPEQAGSVTEPSAPPTAPAPGPVADGRTIEAPTIVCIIEVMKMMNSIPAGVSGTIAEIHVANAQPVEYAQPLFRVDAA